jgi:hypothetical protein
MLATPAAVDFIRPDCHLVLRRVARPCRVAGWSAGSAPWRGYWC